MFDPTVALRDLPRKIPVPPELALCLTNAAPAVLSVAFIISLGTSPSDTGSISLVPINT